MPASTARRPRRTSTRAFTRSPNVASAMAESSATVIWPATICTALMFAARRAMRKCRAESALHLVAYHASASAALVSGPRRPSGGARHPRLRGRAITSPGVAAQPAGSGAGGRFTHMDDTVAIVPADPSLVDAPAVATWVAVDPTVGLSAAGAAVRLAQDGPNELGRSRPYRYGARSWPSSRTRSSTCSSSRSGSRWSPGSPKAPTAHPLT